MKKTLKRRANEWAGCWHPELRHCASKSYLAGFRAGRRSRSRWIDARKRKPKYNVKVLVTDGKNYAVAWYVRSIDDRGFPTEFWGNEYGTMSTNSVTHWPAGRRNPKGRSARLAAFFLQAAATG